MDRIAGLAKRFAVKYELDPNSGCWLWTASRRNGYGQINFNGRLIKATHASLMIRGIEIPADKVVMHKCDNPPCVNPDHLCVGTRKENMQDCVNKNRHFQKAKTHCPHGHELTPDNLLASPNVRACLVCHRQRKRIYYLEVVKNRRRERAAARKKAQAPETVSRETCS